MLRHICAAVLCGLLAAAAPAIAKPAIPDLAELYARVVPAVVTIHATGRTRGIGSGILVHPDGFIVTAAHVVEEATEIVVEFKNEMRFPALIATLSRTEDLALLKVPRIPPRVEVAPLADSSKLRVGEPIFCIGSPLGFRHSLTTGIISAIRNSNHADSLLPRHVIQTDAALNQGSSGGALFNAAGEVVGIASYLQTKGGGGSIGLGFAVPSNVVRERLFHSPLPYLGVSLRHVGPELARLFNWPERDMLLVEYVRPGSLADRAGLRGGSERVQVAGTSLVLGGDLIVKVADLDIDERNRIHRYLGGLHDGQSVYYTIFRQGRTERLLVPLEGMIAIPRLDLDEPPAAAGR